jgi:hypothetical protein
MIRMTSTKQKIKYIVLYVIHKEVPKRNPRPCGAVGRNHRSGATDIIEVANTSNIEKLFNLLVCSNIICCTCKIIFLYIPLFSMNSV